MKSGVKYLLVLAVVSVVGCARSNSSADMAHAEVGQSYSRPHSQTPAKESAVDAVPMLAMAMSPQAIAEGEEGSVGSITPAAANRRIIYTATLELVVENFDGVEKQVNQLVTQHGGYLGSANLDRLHGEQRAGSWVCRIPVGSYGSFLDAAASIGVAETRLQNSQDVSEEFVDLGARIENKKRLEARIIELLERPDDKIQHVIEVERELARVREDIERMEGRLRYLGDMTAMSTVTIQIREERDYVPPRAPTFSDRIARTWWSSVEVTRKFGEGAVLLVVALAIPVAVVAVFLSLFYLIVRRYMKNAKKSGPSPAAG